MTDKTNQQIDSLMASEVRGWRKSFIGFDTFPSMVSGDYPNIVKHCRGDTYAPSTDMDQAMECVEEYKPDYFEMTRCIDAGTGESFYHVEINESVVRDKSAPLAICKAILKAKGIEIV